LPAFRVKLEGFFMSSPRLEDERRADRSVALKGMDEMVAETEVRDSTYLREICLDSENNRAREAGFEHSLCEIFVITT